MKFKPAARPFSGLPRSVWGSLLSVSPWRAKYGADVAAALLRGARAHFAPAAAPLLAAPPAAPLLLVQQQQGSRPGTAGSGGAPPAAADLPAPTLSPLLGRAAAAAPAPAPLAPPAARAPAAPAAAAAAPMSAARAAFLQKLRCPACRAGQAAWVVRAPCRHAGPCIDCCPAPPDGGRELVAPAAYPSCLKCGAGVRLLHRMLL